MDAGNRQSNHDGFEHVKSETSMPVVLKRLPPLAVSADLAWAPTP
jgi:hypothetical protein